MIRFGGGPPSRSRDCAARRRGAAHRFGVPVMGHLMLAMPIFGLAVFWLLPVGLAIPVYVAILAVSVYGFVIGVRARRREVETGVEAMTQRVGAIVEAERDHGRAEVDGEIWNVRSAEPLEVGETVEVIEVADRLTLRVRGLGVRSPHPAAAPGRAGGNRLPAQSRSRTRDD